MYTYSNRLQPALQNLLQRVVRFFHRRSSCMTHISVDVCSGRKSHLRSSMNDKAYIGGRSETLNASCMTISSERTEQLDIFCRISGFTSDFLSFINVELIRFFHGALQFVTCTNSMDKTLNQMHMMLSVCLCAVGMIECACVL